MQKCASFCLSKEEASVAVVVMSGDKSMAGIVRCSFQRSSTWSRAFYCPLLTALF